MENEILFCKHLVYNIEVLIFTSFYFLNILFDHHSIYLYHIHVGKGRQWEKDMSWYKDSFMRNDILFFLKLRHLYQDFDFFYFLLFFKYHVWVKGGIL